MSRLPNYFTIDEFIVNPDMEYVPLHVIRKLEKHHMPQLNMVRHLQKFPLTISKRSGFRPYWWEIDNGRGGTSQHTFGDTMENEQEWLGAVDITSEDIETTLDFIRKSDYKRIAYYPEQKFIHCDYKGNDYQEFIANKGKWVLSQHQREGATTLHMYIPRKNNYYFSPYEGTY